jgi:ubiquinone/menaquinone biosynthesis C-methylase UbiE
MVSYAGRHAELYDLFYADKAYDAEALFVHNCLERFGVGPGSKLFELACGTGSHAFALEKLGYEIMATDNSEGMLEVAKEKASANGSRVQFRLQDMTELSTNGSYDAVICLFDSIGYVRTNENLRKVFAGVKGQLKTGGLFVFEFWHAAAMLCHYDPVRVRRWKTKSSELVRISETSLDCAKQLSSVSYIVYELNDDHTYSTLQETHTNRYFLVQEMAEWLTSAGFSPLAWFSGFTDNEGIDDQTWHVVAVARSL